MLRRIERPTTTTLRPVSTATSIACCMRWMFDAKLETSTRPLRDGMIWRNASPTTRSERVKPARSAFVESREQQVDATVAELGQAPDVGLQAVDRCVVELPVARVKDAAGRGLDREADRVRNRMRHADELDAERTEIDRTCVGIGLAQLGRAQEPMLVELRLDEAERQPRRPDLRDLHLAQEVRQRTDVILVGVRQDDRANRAVAEIAEVGKDQVDSEVLVARERHAGVDDDALVAELVDRHVLADLAQSPERDHTQHVCH